MRYVEPLLNVVLKYPIISSTVRTVGIPIPYVTASVLARPSRSIDSTRAISSLDIVHLTYSHIIAQMVDSLDHFTAPGALRASPPARRGRTAAGAGPAHALARIGLYSTFVRLLHN